MATSKGRTSWETVIVPLQAKLSRTLSPTDIGRHCVSRGLVGHDDLRDILSIRSHSDAMRIDDLLNLLYQTGEPGYKTFKDILHEWSHLPLHAYSRLLKAIEQREAALSQRQTSPDTTFIAEKESNSAPVSSSPVLLTTTAGLDTNSSSLVEEQPLLTERDNFPPTMTNAERPHPSVVPSDTSLLPPGKDPGHGKHLFPRGSVSEAEKQVMITERSRLFRKLAQAFGLQWRAIVDYLIGFDVRKDIESAPTGRANPLSNEDLLFEGLTRWSEAVEEPTGKDLYDAIFFASKDLHKVRKLLVPLELPDWYEPETYF